MKSLLKPSSVAIIGASNDVTKLGGMLVKNMIDAGFDKSKLYPINPKGGEIQGIKAYTSITEVGQPIDVAIIAVKANLVPGEMVNLNKAGVKYASILTAGFKEDSPAGAELEKELIAQATKNGVRFLGPNCFGIMNPAAGVNATFAHLLPKPGNITIFSQSGAVGSSIIDWSYKNKMGLANFITLGNKACLDEADLLPAIEADENTKVIGMYIEGINNGEKFINAVQKVKKPIVAFKSGRTQAGSAAASSHTGSLAGSDAVNDVIMKKLGIHRAMDLDEMFDALGVMSTCSPMKKDGIVIITNAGGLGVMSADAAYDAKYIHALPLKPEIVEEIKERVPTVAGLTNPIDVRGDAKAEYFREVIEIVVKDKDVGGLVIMGSPLDTADLESVAKMLVEIRDDIPVPTTVCFAGGEKCERANDILREGAFPCFPTPDRAVRALDILRQHYVRTHCENTPMETPKIDSNARAVSKKIIDNAFSEGRKALTESEGKEIFAAYGIPTPGEDLVNSADEAVKSCDSIGYPVVMKIVSPDIQHKTDVGGVVVGVKNSEEARASFNKIMESCRKAKPEANLIGVSIQQMVSGQEVILSMIRDAQFGPIVSFGLGGIYVEILREISQCHAPMTEEQLNEMITSTKAYKLMSGARGLPVADIDAMKDTIRRIVVVAMENPEIKELEINPVIVGVKGKGCWAVDALCTLEQR